MTAAILAAALLLDALLGEPKWLWSRVPHPAVLMAYDGTVLAGTQGMRNHQKTDRLLGVALAQKLPVLLWAEGGGGRPGDVDMPIVAGLNNHTFSQFAAL